MKMRVCWNWQTGTFEGRVLYDVRVQVPSLAPKRKSWHESGRIFALYYSLQKRKDLPKTSLFKSVRVTGLEPVRHATHAPQTCLSANSSTLAYIHLFSENMYYYTHSPTLCQVFFSIYRKKGYLLFVDYKQVIICIIRII